MEFDENNERHVNAYEKALERGREEWERRLDDDFPTLTFRWAYSSTVEVEVSCDEDGLDDLEFDNIEVDLSDHGDPEDILNESDLAYAAGDNVREVILEAKSEEWANEHWEEFLEDEETPEEALVRKLTEKSEAIHIIRERLRLAIVDAVAASDAHDANEGLRDTSKMALSLVIQALELASDDYRNRATACEGELQEAKLALEASKAPQEPPEDAVFVLGPENGEGSE